MYSEQLGDFSPKNKDIISTTFKDYEILYGFDKFIERVVSQNPILLLSSNTMKGQTPISKELEGELYIKHYAFGNKPWTTDQVEYFDLFLSVLPT